MLYRPDTLSCLDWKAVAQIIDEHERFTLTTHIRPDTDGVGSEIALHRYLTRRGKQVRTLNPEALSERLVALDPDRGVQPFRDSDAEWVRDSVVIVVDVSECDRLGPLAPHVRGNRRLSICIDHHVNEHRRFATHDMIDPRAPSTGVLVGELLHVLGAEIDTVIAQAIYATIVADTGSFRFSNTTSTVMRLAADLIDLGANPIETHKAVLGGYSVEKVRLLAATLTSPGLACNGRLAWFAVSQGLLEDTRAKEEDTDGLVEYLRLIRGVMAALLFVEIAPDRVKVSFRSEVGLDVNRLANEWGGGGHRHAAGATIDGPLDETVKAVVERAKSTLF